MWIDAQKVAAPERSQFDFWLGSWRVYQEIGAEVSGRNEIAWVLDDAVLQERFTAGTDPFAGWSFSVPVAGRGWVQTWVDSTGGYLDFAGGWLGDRMVLERATGQADPVRQRMTWHCISRDALLWDWAYLAEGRSEWDLKWRLRYERA